MSYKRNRCRKPLTLAKARLRMTDAIAKLEEIIMTVDDDYKKIQAANALSGLIARYAKLTETEDLEKRIEALEAQVEKESKLKTINSKKAG